MEPFMHMKTINTLSGSISEVRQRMGMGDRSQPAAAPLLTPLHPDRP